MYAIVETGGKQFIVEEGGVIRAEALKIPAGEKFTLDRVLLIQNGGDLKIGTPYLNGANVETTVVAHGKEKKVIVYKYKPKKGFHKKKGHRQPYTELKIEKING
jgi:large subunit ribosomal protein L21